MKNQLKIIIVSGIISVTLVALNHIGTYEICRNKFECTEILYTIMLALFPIILLFIFSLITYKMREEVFAAWWKFARVFIPLSVFAVLIAPSYSNNSFFPIDEKGSVLLYFCLNFVISSVLIIFLKYGSLKKNVQYSNKSIAWTIVFSSIISVFVWYSLLMIL